MCTAVSYKAARHYFGRNLDHNMSYGETVTFTPRNHPFVLRRAGLLDHHYAMIGMAMMAGGDPLYFDATNERGLSMAGLNFPDNARYFPEAEGRDNVAPYEFIPWILGRCADVPEARNLLRRINLVDLPFSPELSLAPLHWMISDASESIVVEQTEDGLKVYDDPVGVLTNNPPFSYHLQNLNNYLNVTSEVPESRFAASLPLKRYCLGMGGIGLPGDLSSASRFVRAAFTRLNSVSDAGTSSEISQFFHILASVAQPRGCSSAGDGQYETTLYSSCADTAAGIYYYTTYENSQITAVDMRRENLDGCMPVSYPLVLGQQIRMQN